MTKQCVFCDDTERKGPYFKLGDKKLCYVCAIQLEKILSINRTSKGKLTDAEQQEIIVRIDKGTGDDR